MPKPPEPFGHAVARLRERAGLTRYALAKAAGLTQSHLTRLEEGDNSPSFAVVRRLALALGAGPEAFWGCTLP